MSLTRLVAIHRIFFFFSVTERCAFQFVKYRLDPAMVSESTLNKERSLGPALKEMEFRGIRPLAFAPSQDGCCYFHT